MKSLLTVLFAFLFTALMVAAPAGAAQSKSKEKQTPKAGQSYSGSGTVIKNNVDICMVTGLRWALHPENGEEVKVYPKTKHATEALDQAAKNNSTVHVAGTWKESLGCHYVETSKVSSAKK
jgi:hypothetical protein